MEIVHEPLKKVIYRNLVSENYDIFCANAVLGDARIVWCDGLLMSLYPMDLAEDISTKNYNESIEVLETIIYCYQKNYVPEISYNGFKTSVLNRCSIPMIKNIAKHINEGNK